MKKLVTLALCALFTVGVLAGCGGKTKTGATSATKTTSEVKT